jgi:hypothetical protein
MKSLTQIADQITVCPVPGGGYRFNGQSSLSEAANRIEPLLADLAPLYHTACMRALECRLGLDPVPASSSESTSSQNREVA